MKKPTGKPGNLLDRHYRCLAIECRIQDQANTAILGVDSTESSHCGDDGSKDSDVDDGIADAAYDGAAEGDDVGSPLADIQFSPVHPENEVDDVDEEVVAVNDVGELNEAVACGEDAAKARPQLLPLLNQARSAVSSSASRGGGGGGSKSTASRRSLSSFVTKSGGGGVEERPRIPRIVIVCHC